MMLFTNILSLTVMETLFFFHKMRILVHLKKGKTLLQRLSNCARETNVHTEFQVKYSLRNTRAGRALWRYRFTVWSLETTCCWFEVAR